MKEWEWFLIIAAVVGGIYFITSTTPGAAASGSSPVSDLANFFSNTVGSGSIEGVSDASSGASINPAYLTTLDDVTTGASGSW